MKTGIIILLLAIPTLSPLSYAQDLEYVNSTLWTNVNDVDVVGEYAYCVFSNGLVILDVSNPAQPELVSRLYLYGSGKAIEVSGNYAYIADFNSGIKIIDVSDLSDPALISAYDTPGHSYDIFISGDYAYIADGTSGLQIINIEVPSSPIFAGSYDSITAVRLFVSDQFAYIARDHSSVKIIDISNPESPAYAGNITTGINPCGVYISDNYAYIISDIDGIDAAFQIFDVTDPANPTVTDYAHLSVFDPRDIYLQDSLAFITGRYYSYIADVSDPESIIVLTYINASGYGVHIENEIAYIAGDNEGVYTINIADPANPFISGMYGTPDITRNVYVSGQYAYTANMNSGIYILDVSDPYEPAILINHEGAGGILNVFVSGNYAYTSSNPQDNYLYLGIIDISNPLNPINRSFYDTDGYIFEISVSGNYAYLANRSFLSIDVSDPDNPTGAWTYPEWNLFDVFVEGQYAYATVGSGDRRLIIFDISDPENPVTVIEYFIASPQDIYVSEGLAFIPMNSSGMDIYDVSDPYNPAFVSNCNPSGWADLVYVTGDFAYVAGESRLDVIDISDPYNPNPVNNYITNDDIEGLFVTGEYIYVADGGSLLILRNPTTGAGEEIVSLPDKPYLLQNFPNPFNASTAIEFSLPEAADVELAVYNLLGQKVALLFDGLSPAGDHSVIWDAGDLPSGIYFSHLATGSEIRTSKMILLK